MKRRQLYYLTLSHLLLILLLMTSGLPLQASPQSQRGLPLTLTPLDIPRQWVELVQEQVDKQGLDLPATARLSAYLMIALYEATLPDMAGATSLAGKLTTMPALPQPKVGMSYDTAAVAIGALSSVAAELLTAALPTEAGRRASRHPGQRVSGFDPQRGGFQSRLALAQAANQAGVPLQQQHLCRAA